MVPLEVSEKYNQLEFELSGVAFLSQGQRNSLIRAHLVSLEFLKKDQKNKKIESLLLKAK